MKTTSPMRRRQTAATRETTNSNDYYRLFRAIAHKTQPYNRRNAIGARYWVVAAGLVARIDGRGAHGAPINPMISCDRASTCEQIADANAITYGTPQGPKDCCLGGRYTQ
jgi:hypothetical protein